MSVTKPASTLLTRSTARRAISRAAVVAFVGIIPVVGCECRDVIPLNPEAPALVADVCATPANVDGEGNQIGGTSDCLLAFGEADLTVKAERFVVLSNPGQVDLVISKLDIVGDPAFELIGTPPTRILAGLSVQVGVKTRPTVPSAITAEIQIVSDAANVTTLNDDGKPLLVIPITLTGVDNGLPDIEIVPDPSCGTTTPLGVDFDFAAVGGIKLCDVLVYNRGVRDLYFDSLEFVDVDGDGKVHGEPADSDEVAAIRLTGTPPGPDTPLPPTNTDAATGALVDPLRLRLAFSPDVLGRYESVLRFKTSDPDEDEAEIDLPIVGKGVVGPTCVAEIKSVNGVATPPFSIEPLDDVVITVENSTFANGEITFGDPAVSWEITARGGGSTVVPTAAGGIDTGFAFADRRGIDVAGRYEACAVVTDTLGVASQNRCCVAFEAIPSQAFLVQLSWANPTGDLDLHVSKRTADGDYCVDSLGQGGNVAAPFSEDCGDDLSCNWLNCRSDDTNFPEWDSLPGRSIGDPTLDIDDTSGFGPENTNVDVIEPGAYAFGFTTFSGGIDFLATTRLFIFGRLAGEWPVDATEEFVEVGIAYFTAEDPSHPCIEDLTDNDPDDDCPGY